MATRLANHGGPNPHTSGIFADMTVDGPEMGTLVVIVDRAKNLPNRKTMGKQNPYCAARLGKEAKKTDTDRRGGQTPKWDKELRFTVHDSPDYHTLKISIFSEDKKATDLIGEALVSLDDILVPGGGKSDLWQGLNCKGKYAGELRVELTYYDTRPKPEYAESVAESEELRQSSDNGSNRVKRRPLPSNPNSRHVTPDTIPGPANPGRAKHGPRDFSTPPRAQTMPPEVHSYPYSPHMYADPSHAPVPSNESAAPAPLHQTPPHQYYQQDAYGEPQQYDDELQIQTPDFLPQLPPSNRTRPMQPRYGAPRQPHHAPQPRPHSHVGLPHSQSAPVVPQVYPDPQSFDDASHLRTDYPEPIPDLDYQHQQIRQRRNDVPPGWQNEYGSPYSDNQPYMEEDSPAPPPPPMHSNSAPVVPHFTNGNHQLVSSPASPYGSSPQGLRHNSVPNSSPLQNIETSYGPTQRTPVPRHPARGGSMDSYAPSHEQSPYGSPPTGHMPGQTPSPYSRQQSAPAPMPHRNSIANPYNTTPSRPTPLSQQVPRSHSPQPPYLQHGKSPRSFGYSPYERDQPASGEMPLYKPRAISPRDAARAPPSVDQRPNSSYSLQHPVRAFESADGSSLSTSRPDPRLPQAPGRGVPLRKSVSSNASPAASTPWGPDDFGTHNPNPRPLPTANSASPHSPYQIRPGSETHPREEAKGPIVGWNGQEIDPSDHLPIDSWAPEPEKKTPEKTYGQGRTRDFGPRGVPSAGGRNLSRDTVVNVRMKGVPSPNAYQQQQQQQELPDISPTRNKLQKKSNKSPGVEPLREHHNYNNVSVPNPYEQGQGYSGAFYAGGQQDRSPVYGGGSPQDALTREISSIDIGSGSGRHSRQGSAPAPVAYVPVRSHRDRNTYY